MSDPAGWIEHFLVHGEGDFYGQPFRLEDWQRRLLARLYAEEDGERKFRRALVGMPKGNGKTELAAAVACYELASGVTSSPLIPVAAASFEQADLVFGAAKVMIGAGPLAPFFDVWDTEIRRRDGPGRMFRVAAAAGTADGLRPTFAVFDELHEWDTPRRERVHLVIANGLAKRARSWELSITTAGWDPESLLGRLYNYGLQVNSGEVADPAFLMHWIQASDHWDLSDREQLEAAVAEANPAGFLPHHKVLDRFSEVPEYEFRRYHLNQWTSTASQWLPTGAWEQLDRCDPPGDGTEIVLAFDGSYNRDSTALVGVYDGNRVFVVAVWERPERGGDDWQVSRTDVLDTIDETFSRWRVLRMVADPAGWHRELEELAERYGPEVVLAMPNTRARMVPACSRFYTGVVAGDLSHDGSKVLARHLRNAALKETPNGAYIVKETRDSPRKIDAAVAAVMAFDTAAQLEPAADPQVMLI